jgi:two-component system, cell cycle sensor histidine kinase and response regulator CckA
LEQAIMNLAVNARDAMPDGGRLSLETDLIRLDAAEARGRPNLPPGPYVCLTVRDTGVGMDADTRQRVFEPFFTTKDQGKGTGLGLSMVYGFVKQSNGHIELLSEPGAGSTFKLYLPWTSDAGKQTESLPSDDSPPQGTETILVVEDEESVRQLVTKVLRRQGYTVLESGNAREALPLGEHYDGQLDLLITDVVMPEVSGPELAERLKAARPTMPVLFISGYPDRPMVQETLAAGNAHLLAKPFQPTELLDIVRKMLDDAASQGNGQ